MKTNISILISLCFLALKTSFAQLPIAGFAASDSLLCQYDCVSFTNLSVNATSYQWYFQGGTPSISTNQNPYVCYQYSGVYNVSLVAINGSNKDSISSLNYINVNPGPPIPNITLKGDTLFCSIDPSYITYQWYLDTLTIPGATNEYYVVTRGGNYNVQVSNQNSCSVAVGINVAPFTPTIAFTSTAQNICAGTCITFNNNTTDAFSYIWHFPGGTPSTSTAVNPQVCYNTAGTYDVQLVATGNGGTDSLTKSNFINVAALPSLTVSASSTSICIGDVDTLFITGAVAYSWAPATGLDNPFSTMPLASPFSTTTYTVTGTNANGCAATATITITVNPRPIILIISDTTICQGTSAQLHATGGLGATYSWSPDSGLSAANIPNPVCAARSTTTYTVTVSAGACASTATVTVTVLPPPVKPVITKSSDTLYSSTDISYIKYQWYLDYQLIPGSTDSIYTDLKKAIYSVEVTDSLGCKSMSDTFNVTCGHMIINGSVTKITCDTCYDGSISLSIYGGTPPYYYLWSTGGTLDNLNNIAKGFYPVTVTDGSFCSDTTTFQMTCCRNSCGADFYIYPDSLLPHHYNIVSTSSGVAPLKYLWSWGDNTFDTIPFPTHTYASAGFYPVCLKITDATSCIDSSCHTFQLFRTDGSVITMTVIDTLLLNQLAHSKDISLLYPNPVSELLTLYLPSIENNSIIYISLFNAVGQKITAPFLIQDKKILISTKNFSNGLYFINVYSEKLNWQGRFIKE